MSAKSYPIANQEQRREFFHEWFQYSKKILPGFFFFGPLFGLSTAFVFTNDILQFWYMIILTGIHLLLLIFLWRMKVVETIRFFYKLGVLYAIMINLYFYMMFLSMLILFGKSLDIKTFWWIQIYIAIVGLIIYFLVKRSWNQNFGINSLLLLKERPYIRFFSVLTTTEEVATPMNRFNGPATYCIFLPDIVSEKTLERIKHRYQYGGNPIRYGNGLITLSVGIGLSVQTYLFQKSPLLQSFLLPSFAAGLFLYAFIYMFRVFVVYQGMRAIDKQEGITFLPYFLKPQEEVDAEMAAEEAAKASNDL